MYNVQDVCDARDPLLLPDRLQLGDLHVLRQAILSGLRAVAAGSRGFMRINRIWPSGVDKQQQHMCFVRRPRVREPLGEAIEI